MNPFILFSSLILASVISQASTLDVIHTRTQLNVGDKYRMNGHNMKTHTTYNDIECTVRAQLNLGPGNQLGLILLAEYFCENLYDPSRKDHHRPYTDNFLKEGQFIDARANGDTEIFNCFVCNIPKEK